MLQSLKILIAGENDEACWLLRLILQQEPDLVVVGRASTGHELSTLALDLTPQVVLLDLDAPGPGVAAALERIRLQQLQISVIGLAGSTAVHLALANAVDRVLPKDLPISELCASIRDVFAGAMARPAPPSKAEDSADHTRDQLLSLYLSDLERRHQGLEERINLIQFWLEAAAAGGKPSTVPSVDGLGSGIPSYGLSVDGFFNAQHQVTIGGVQGALHPHSWRVNVRLRQERRDALGSDYLMLGFAEAKQLLRGEISWLEGKVLNSLPMFAEIPPTTENIATLLYRNLKRNLRESGVTIETITVWETPTNAITYSES